MHTADALAARLDALEAEAVRTRAEQLRLRRLVEKLAVRLELAEARLRSVPTAQGAPR